MPIPVDKFKGTHSRCLPTERKWIVYRIDFDTVVSGLEHGSSQMVTKKWFTTTLARQSFNTNYTPSATARKATKCVFRVLNTGISTASKRTWTTLWRDSDRYTVTVNGKLWMPMKLKKVEHPYYADEPHRAGLQVQAFACSRVIRNDGIFSM